MFSKMVILIPVYNPRERIINYVKKLKEKNYDVVVINDGSKDSTSNICHDKGYQIIDLAVNLGLAGAFQTGLKYAYMKGYDHAIQFDADGQHLANYIESLYNKQKEGYDIVIGSRFTTKRKPKTFRMLGSSMISFAMRVTTGNKITDPTSGMRMFNKKMIREFALNLNYGPEPDTISYLLKNGATIAEIQVEMEERMEGACPETGRSSGASAP